MMDLDPCVGVLTVHKKPKTDNFFDISWYSTSCFSIHFGLTSSIKFSVSRFLIVKNYGQKNIKFFLSVGILKPTLKMPMVLMVLTYLDIQLHIFLKISCFTLPAKVSINNFFGRLRSEKSSILSLHLLTG